MSGSVLVTGVSGGLGGAVAYRLAVDGWRVVGVSRSAAGRPEAASDQAAAPAAGASSPVPPDPLLTRPEQDPTRSGPGPTPTGPILTLAADVADPAGAAAAVELAAADPARPLRAVVNLVGGFSGGGRVHQTPVEQFEAALRLNLRPTYLVTAAALPHLVAAGGGSVVCVGSRAALHPFPGSAGYIAAKAGLLGLVDALAVEYRRDGVRANAVLPSVIDTPANRAAQPDADVSRWVTPQQVADVIGFLCSEASGAMSGAHIPVYGRV